MCNLPKQGRQGSKGVGDNRGYDLEGSLQMPLILMANSMYKNK
jgi:hypothetical protein